MNLCLKIIELLQKPNHYYIYIIMRLKYQNMIRAILQHKYDNMERRNKHRPYDIILL